jgi:hypothetical protein
MSAHTDFYVCLKKKRIRKVQKKQAHVKQSNNSKEQIKIQDSCIFSVTRSFNTGDSAYYISQFSSPAEARQVRKHKLDRRKSKIHDELNSVDECGHFDEEYVQALQGDECRFKNYTLFPCLLPIVPPLVLNKCTFIVSASYPKRSDHGLPNLCCRYRAAVFWHAERVGGIRGSCNIRYNNYCRNGKVSIPPYRPRPEPLGSLARFADDAASMNFMKNIRQYNCLFAFTSMEADIDRSVNDGGGPPLFKIHGQVYHRIGSLLPPDDGPPKFLQPYIYDTANEVHNRLN